MTERLYYTDAYMREFRARVVQQQGDLVYLDRTAFYPTSGGQPFDTGSIAGAAVLEVIDEGDRIAHRTASPITPGEAACSVDWVRRFDHMQQHTGQHLLSAVFADLFDAGTVGFHLGQDTSTIDLDKTSLTPDQVCRAEERANRIVFENRPVTVTFEDSATARKLRKPSEREGTIRIINIDGFDRSACGGTHVRSTGEIGPILIRKLEKIRASLRVEFLCGLRAVRRARADFEALTRVAQMFSAALDETPGMVAAQLEAARAGEKLRRKLESDLAAYKGRELYDGTAPDACGFRRITRRLPQGSLEELRGIAQSFTARSKAVFLGVLENPPSVLLAVSEDAGIDAGKAVKSSVMQSGGRGGGTARMAQGSVPGTESLQKVLEHITSVVPFK
ncbi:MAG: DHHA1 domain-containing protein [Acidobacteria bacterium]|nr:DHHA1 domain-containing protein [Acidobacteriota bacterium]